MKYVAKEYILPCLKYSNIFSLHWATLIKFTPSHKVHSATPKISLLCKKLTHDKDIADVASPKSWFSVKIKVKMYSQWLLLHVIYRLQVTWWPIWRNVVRKLLSPPPLFELHAALSDAPKKKKIRTLKGVVQTRHSEPSPQTHWKIDALWNPTPAVACKYFELLLWRQCILWVNWRKNSL
jgi:hypothetical protein